MAKRRSSGDGSVYQLETGRDAGKWVAQVDLGYSPDGRRLRPRRVRPTERQAKEALRELLKLRAASVTEISTVHAWLDHWLEHVIAPNRAASTHATYSGALSHAKSGLPRNLLLIGLRAEHVRVMQAKLRDDGLTPARVRYVTDVLGVAVNAAVGEKRLPSSPVKHVLKQMPKPLHVKTPALTWSQAVKALDATTDPRTRARLVLGFWCGLRPSEALGVRWDDIDLTEDGGVWRGTLHIHGQIGRHGAAVGQYVKPKSTNGDRRIPLEPVAADVLATWRDECDSPWVLPHPDDPSRPIRYETDRTTFQAALRAAEVPAITPHGARATFTSRLLDRGVSVAVAARLLGDDPRTLVKHYARTEPGVEREAIAALEDTGRPALTT